MPCYNQRWPARAALSAKDNACRPGHYILLQEEEKRVFGAANVESSLRKGYDIKYLLGDKPWQDVLLRDIDASQHSGSRPITGEHQPSVTASL